MKVAICKKVVNKSKDFDTLAYRFENLDLDQTQLADAINAGYPLTTWHTGGRECRWQPTEQEDKQKHRCEQGWLGQHRRQENFLAAGYIGLDFDSLTPETAQELTTEALILDYASIIYQTPSHTEAAPRLRVLFELEQEITEPAEYRRAVQALMWHYELKADASCKDPCRFFYGSKDSYPIITGNVLTVEVLAGLVTRWEKETGFTSAGTVEANPAPRLKTGRMVSQEEIDEARISANSFLKACRLGSWSDYGQWQKAAALARSLDRAFTNANGQFYEIFKQASRSHPDYRPADEVKLEKDFTKLKGASLPFEGLGLEFNWQTKQVSDPSLPGFEPYFGERPAQQLVETVDPETGKIIQAATEDRDLVYFTADDEGNAEAFIKVYGANFKYCAALGWLYWTGKFWDTRLGDSIVDKKVTEVLRRRRIAAIKEDKESIAKVCITDRKRINNCKQGLEKRLAVEADIFDRSPDLLNCNNGVVDLRTGQLTAHHRSQLFTYCLETDYQQDAPRANWTNFIESVVGNGPEVKKYIQMAVGYTLTGRTNEECLFFLYGPSRSGKGTFTETLMALMPEPLSSEVNFNLLAGDRATQDGNNFELAPLRPSRAVFASESQRHERLNSGRAKALTGGNKVRCCFKHKTHFNYQPQFKIWLSSNWPVNGDVDDTALWGRVRVVEFPNSHLGEEDKQLKDRMKSPENLRGVLAWAVEGAIEWYKAWESGKGLGTPKAVKEWTEQQRTAADFVQQWLNECTEPDETFWTPNTEVTTSYRKWCEENNTHPKGAKLLAEALKSKGYTPSQLKKRDGKVERGVQGFRIL